MSFLAVDSTHSLYYELSNRADGLPVIYLHGGPGVGCTDSDRKIFDLNTQRVLFFDQRGAGLSTPSGDLSENTTEHLLNDIDFMMETAGFRQAIFAGGSWGATLALLYAIRSPEKVRGLILRGTFLADSLAVKYHFGHHIEQEAPEVYEKLFRIIPESRKDDFISYLYEQISSGSESERDTLLREWLRYSLSLSSKEMQRAIPDSFFNTFNYAAIAAIELHYFAHHFFIPEGYIEDNIGTISHIPAWFIHGRYDRIADPERAESLSGRFQKSTFISTDSGHSARDVATEDALRKTISTVYKSLA